MSHVLLGGDEQQMARIRFLLTQWDVTVGPLAFGNESSTVLACDAVVVVGASVNDTDPCLGTLPDGPGGAAGPAAPLIFIGDQMASSEPHLTPWLKLDQVDADGANLRRALHSAYAEARNRRSVLRCDAASETLLTAVDEEDLHFLGHELRSPLTALLTALEAMNEPVGNVAPDQGDAQRKMTAIALRNARRLHETIDWSQELLATRELPVTAQSRVVPVSELPVVLSDLPLAGIPGEVAFRELFVDPDLLASLTSQMVRVLRMIRPGCRPEVRLSSGTTGPHTLQITMTGDSGQEPTAGLVSTRNRFAPYENPLAYETLPELERLSRHMIAVQLPAQLGATLRPETTEDDRPVLVITLPLQPHSAVAV